MAKRAILYARVSTTKQAELYSLDYQIAQERQYAEEMGLEVVAEFQDDQSGRKMERDGLTEARQMLSEDKADVLVVWKLDRLHRSYVNTVVLRDEIQRLGKQLYYAQSRTKSGTRAKERLPEDILALMAEIEADEIAERTAMGRRQKALSGKWIGLFKPPYGYTSAGIGRTKRVLVDEDQAAIVRMIFDWYVYGDEEGPALSTYDIAQKLTRLGIPTPADHLDNPTFKKKQGYGEWSRTTIYRILHETGYNGTYYQFKRKEIQGESRRNPDLDEYVAVPFPAIVDKETFDLAAEKLTNGRNLSKRNSKNELLLSRRVWCECGYKMLTNILNRTYTRKTDGKVSDYSYRMYRCRGQRKDSVRACRQKAVDSDLLDNRVWEYVRTEIANPAVLERKLKELKENQEEQKAPITERLAMLNKHRETIIDELRRLALLYAKNSMPEHLLTELIEQQNHKLRLTEAEIERLEEETVEPLSDNQIADLVSFAKEFEAHLSSLEQDNEAKRFVIEGLDVKVIVKTIDNTQFLEISTLLNPQSVLWTLDYASAGVKQSLTKRGMLVKGIISLRPK